MKLFPLVGEQNILLCPVCGFNFNHFRKFKKYGKSSPNDYDDEVYSLDFKGECGHHWELCIEHHEGHSFLFRRVRL